MSTEFIDDCGIRPDREMIYKSLGDINLRMLIFDPAQHEKEEPLPSVLLIHGGGWKNGSPDIPFYKQIGRSFNAIGFRTFSIEYRLLNKSAKTIADCIADSRSAMRFLILNSKELGIDIKKIVVCGGSSGAHLALSNIMFDTIKDDEDNLSISTNPSAAILFYPVIDTSPEGYGNSLLGSDVFSSASWQKNLSLKDFMI